VVSQSAFDLKYLAAFFQRFFGKRITKGKYGLFPDRKSICTLQALLDPVEFIDGLLALPKLLMLFV